MENHAIEQVSKTVFQRFPGLKGSRPKVQSYPDEQFLLIYSASAKTEDGKTLRQTVRVVASAAGKIIKLTASR